MARIGRQIPHYEAIENSAIEAEFSPDRKFRYLLSLKFADTLLDRDRSKSLSVIMKNPSSADENMADATIRKVETFVYTRFKDVRFINVLNIFAYRATEPGDLDEEYKTRGTMAVIGKENDRIISRVLKESDYTILAWGNNSGIDKVLYEERIYRIRMLLQAVPAHSVFQIAGKSATKQPLHGLMWGYDYEILNIVEAVHKR